jgi:hypothetical protein
MFLNTLSGVTALIPRWDNAAWHVSQEVRIWVRAHHHRGKWTGQEVRIVPCRLPTESPWLNPIEPNGSMQMNRAGTLSAAQCRRTRSPRVHRLWMATSSPLSHAYKGCLILH